MVDKKKEKHEEIHFLNSLIRTIRDVNRMLVKEKDPLKIIESVTNILIELGGFLTVWIHIKGYPGNKEIYSEAGIGQKFSKLKKYHKENPKINCTSGLEKAIIKKIESPEKECSDCPLKDIYSGRSVFSAIVRYEESNYGTITVSFDQKFSHVKEVRSLLIDISGDLGFKLHDIEIEENAKKERWKSEKFLKSVFNSVQDGMSVLDKDLNIIMVNQKMEEWYAGNMPLVGKKCFNCYHNFKEPCDPCPSLRVLKSGKTEMEIVPGLPGSGINWLELYSFPMKGPEGEIYGILEFVRDITEKRILQNRLSESEERYRLLFENSNIGIGISDEEGNLIDANEVMCKVYGYSRDEFEHINLNDVYANPGDRDELMKKLKKDGSVALYEVKMKRKSGEVFWASLSINKVKIMGRDLLLTACVDISMRKKSELELLEYKERLEEMVEKRTKEIEKINSELSERNDDLERFFEAAMNREYRIKELKDRVDDLQKRLKTGKKN